MDTSTAAAVTSPAWIGGLSAFPLTPFRRDSAHDDTVDEVAFTGLIDRCVAAGVDSIAVLGSTGSGMYVTESERTRVVELAVEHARGVPVVVGVSSLRAREAARFAVQAEEAGASAVLVAPVTYQGLGPEEILGLYRTVTAATSLPVIVYDNPGTTHVTFTTELYGRIAELPGIASIKIPPLPADLAAARQRVAEIRAVLPAHVSLGISGDSSGVRGLLAGCETWYSVFAGLAPATAMRLARLAQSGDEGAALAASARLQPLWDLNDDAGSLRVVAALAADVGLVEGECLPLPLQGLGEGLKERRLEVARLLDA